MARRADEIPDPERPGHWMLSHWAADGLVAGITDATTDLSIRGRAPAERAAAWERLLARYPGCTGAVVAPQVHGRDVLLHERVTPGLNVTGPADGHLSARPGVLLAVTVADCVPVYLRSLATDWCGLVHAGWRGVAGGILEQALGQLARAGAPPGDIIMHCGVSICGTCYEVGHEVHRAVRDREVAGPAPIDLRAVLAERAGRLGVGQVTASGLCALEHPQFHSHRGSGGAAARMAAYLGRSA